VGGAVIIVGISIGIDESSPHVARVRGFRVRDAWSVSVKCVRYQLFGIWIF
jgi:hypothetical protein